MLARTDDTTPNQGNGRVTADDISDDGHSASLDAPPPFPVEDAKRERKSRVRPSLPADESLPRKRGRPPGYPKTGGRQKGTPNVSLDEMATEAERFALEVIQGKPVYCGPSGSIGKAGWRVASIEQRIKMAQHILDKRHADKKAVESTATIDQTVRSTALVNAQVIEAAVAALNKAGPAAAAALPDETKQVLRDSIGAWELCEPLLHEDVRFELHDETVKQLIRTNGKSAPAAIAAGGESPGAVVGGVAPPATSSPPVPDLSEFVVENGFTHPLRNEGGPYVQLVTEGDKQAWHVVSSNQWIRGEHQTLAEAWTEGHKKMKRGELT